MKTFRRSRRSTSSFTSAAAFLALALAVSCDDGIGLLTMDERQSLYKAEFSGRGVSLPATSTNQGVILDPADGIWLSFETLRGSEEPAALVVTLAGGEYSTSVRYLAGQASAPDVPAAQEIRVPSLASFSRTLAIPPVFPDGYYELVLDARSSKSESLSYSRIGLFLARGSLPSPSILAYPANPSPGSRVLLVADLSGYEGRDPYLRWTVDGTVRSEGPASEGRDKLLWPAPQAGFAAPVGLALYPAAPPPGTVFSFPPPRSASAGLLVAAGTPVAEDEFSRAERFRALFRMEDTPDYAGRPGGAASFLGKPRLDVHPGGFGLVLGGEAGAGIRADTLLLPLADGKLQPFTVLARLVPAKPAGGVLFRSEAGTAGPSLEISLVEGRPTVVLRSGDRAAEVRADSLLTAGRSGLLGVTVLPEGPGLRVSFLVDGRPSGGGYVGFGAAGWTEDGVTTVAGPGGCPGLYDEAGVWAYDDRGGASAFPSFRFSARRELGSSLRLAEGFEGAYGPEPVMAGGASILPEEGLGLSPGASARFDPALEAPFNVQAALLPGPTPVLELSGPGGSFRFTWNPDSARMDASSGLPLVEAQVRPAGEGGGILVSAGGEMIKVPGAGPWKLGLAGPESGRAVVRWLRAFRSEGIAGD